MSDEDIVKGLPGLLDSMGELPLTLQRTLIVRALREGAEPIEQRIKDLSPDDPNTSSSRVRDSIDTNVIEQTASGARALIGPTKSGFFAGFAEFGTVHQPARPFISRAFDALVETAWAIVHQVLGDGIEKALKKRK